MDFTIFSVVIGKNGKRERSFKDFLIKVVQTSLKYVSDFLYIVCRYALLMRAFVLFGVINRRV